MMLLIFKVTQSAQLKWHVDDTTMMSSNDNARSGNDDVKSSDADDAWVAETEPNTYAYNEPKPDDVAIQSSTQPIQF